MRLLSLLVPVLALLVAAVAHAQQPDRAAVVDRALHSGDGLSAGTAYAVPGLLWEYELLGRLNLRFVRQRAADAAGMDVVTTRDAKTGDVRDIWFHAAVPDVPSQAETDRVVRSIVTSGDGLSPETAFVVGGRIGAEYQILRFMGIRSAMQSLVTIRGCSFDRLSGQSLDTNEPRDLYFKLGHPSFDYSGECALTPRP